MTRDDALGLLRYMSACWSNHHLEDDEIEVWVDHLRGVTPDDGRESVRLLKDSDQWFPRPARFRETSEAVRRRREREQVAAGMLGSGEKDTSKESALEWIRAMREGLNDSRVTP